MSQFFIIEKKYTLVEDIVENVKLIATNTKPLINSVSKLYYGNVDTFSIVDLNEGSSEKIFIDAQFEMQDGVDITATRLGKIITCLINAEISFTLWYGDDYLDLTEYSELDLLLKNIATEIQNLPGEIYLRYLP